MSGEDAEDDKLAPLLYECRPAGFKGAFAAEWSVAGVEGGDSTHGKIMAVGDSGAVFVAPSKKPDPATVRVNASFYYSSTSSRKVKLAGRVTITTNEKYNGTFTVKATTAPVDWTATGTATWKTSSQFEYVVTGRVKIDKEAFTVPNGTCTLTGTERTFEYDSGSILETEQGPPTIFWAIGPVSWGANCCDANGKCQMADQWINMQWVSGCAGHWAALDEAAFKNDGTLKGSYTWPGPPCIPGVAGVPTFKVDWTFTPIKAQP
jgi:hypothetical protein